MRKTLQKCLLLIAISAFFPMLVFAQCTYTYNKSGNFSDLSNRIVTAGVCNNSVPMPSSSDKIIIDGVNIVLDQNYTIADNGSLQLKNGGTFTVDNNVDFIVGDKGLLKAGETTLIQPDMTTTVVPGGSIKIGARGSLEVKSGGRIDGGNLTVGDGTASQRVTNLIIQANSGANFIYDVALDQITVNKGTVQVQANAFLKTACNLVLTDAKVIVKGIIVVRGNLDLSGGNTTICGIPDVQGTIAVLGCVFADAGQIGQLFNNCPDNKPGICAALQRTCGAGPVKPGANISCSSDIPSSGQSCKPLPVELVEFSAVANRQGVALRWVTASEKNNKDFTLERSADGKLFRSFRSLPGIGNSQNRTTYESTDDQPLPGLSYYRLRQTDIDGTVSFSPARSVKLSISTRALEVYPSPSAQEWTASSSLPAELTTGNAATVQVFDAVGRVQQVACTPDGSMAGRWTLDLHTLPSGIYIVRLVTASGSYSQRIAK